MEFNIKKFKLMRICKKESPFLSDQLTRKYSSNNRIVTREPGPKKSKLSFSISLACFDQFPFFFPINFWISFTALWIRNDLSRQFVRNSLSRDFLGNSIMRFIFHTEKTLPPSNLHWLAWNGSCIRNVKGRKEEKKYIKWLKQNKTVSISRKKSLCWRLPEQQKPPQDSEYN